MVAKQHIGSATVWSLGISCADRNLEQVSGIFSHIDGAAIASAVADESGVAAATVDGKPGYHWCFNASLIELPDRRILVDTGFSFEGGGPGSGIRDLLEEAGATPDTIDTVFITHAHGDHVGGMLDGDTAAFPNAELCMAEAELSSWEKSADAAPKIDAYASRTRLLPSNPTVVAEAKGAIVRSIPAPGHTPGHTGLEVAGNGELLWLLVDTLHTVFQLAHTNWSPRFDFDASVAAITRKNLLSRAVVEAPLVHLYHFPFPAFGRITEGPDGFRFAASE